MRSAPIALAIALAGCSSGGKDAYFRGTIDGPLAGDRAIPSGLSGGEKLSDLGAEGLRALVRPTFGRYAYYLSFQRLPPGCLPRDRLRSDGSNRSQACGTTRVRVRRTDQFDHSAATAGFFLPVEESDDLFEELDARLARWHGINFGGTDGTGVDVERVRDGRATSMSSNASPSRDRDNPAAQLRGDMLRILLAYGPAGFAPRSGSWDVRPPQDDGDPCNNPALAEPLDRGFGTGNSDCDAAARW